MNNLTVGAALVCSLAIAPGILFAQKADPPPIADNSFLLEEAYNQEARVVQHISGFLRPSTGGSWAYSFTQEWPFFGQKNQLSVTVPVLHLDTTTGIGDVALNYRYQLVGTETRVSVSPRLSLLLPTGKEDDGLGSGAVGVQVNIPVSITVSEQLVTHWNAGATITPSAVGAGGAKATTTGFNLGASAIWLAMPTVNLMLEAVYARDQFVVAPDSAASVEEFFVVPGVRGALNFSNGLQIVPGLGYLIGAGPSSGSKGLFLYLSFEHPF